MASSSRNRLWRPAFGEMRDSGCAGSWTCFHAGAVLPTLANLGARKFLASVAMASPTTPTRSQSQTKE
jgi:hypothetical protein